MKVAVQCEAKKVKGRCTDEATVWRYTNGAYFSLCDGCRLLPTLHLDPPDPVKLYHQIWRNGKEA